MAKVELRPLAKARMVARLSPSTMRRLPKFVEARSRWRARSTPARDSSTLMCSSLPQGKAA
eukprot:80232-Lingulodinium_polyedra.AAC.1